MPQQLYTPICNNEQILGKVASKADGFVRCVSVFMEQPIDQLHVYIRKVCKEWQAVQNLQPHIHRALMGFSHFDIVGVFLRADISSRLYSLPDKAKNVSGNTCGIVIESKFDLYRKAIYNESLSCFFLSLVRTY